MPIAAARLSDFEFVESFRVDGYDGPIAYNSEEVAEVRFASLEQLAAEMRAAPELFTPWLREEFHAVYGTLPS